jgi:YVTN family beta-propeller protein
VLLVDRCDLLAERAARPMPENGGSGTPERAAPGTGLRHRFFGMHWNEAAETRTDLFGTWNTSRHAWNTKQRPLERCAERARQVTVLLAMRPNLSLVSAALLLALLLLSTQVPAADRAYVSNEDGETVTVLDTRDGSVVATIAVGKRPRGLKLSRDGSVLYVAVSGLPKCPPSVPDAECAKLKHDLQADGIAMIDTRTLKLRGLLKSGSDPEQFDVSRDGKRLFVSNEDSARATVLDTGTAAIVGTIPTGHEPEGVRVSPNGKWLLITSETDSTVSIIDSSSLKVLKTVHVGVRPRDAAFTSDSRTAYVSGEGDASLSRVPIPSGEPVTRVLQLSQKARPMGVVFDPARKRIYVSTGRGGTVAVVQEEGGGGKLLKEIPVGARPWGIALSHDGRRLFTANGPSDDVTIIDTSSLSVVKKVPVGKGPWGVVVGR